MRRVMKMIPIQKLLKIMVAIAILINPFTLFITDTKATPKKVETPEVQQTLNTTMSRLKDKYRQNEELEVTVAVFNTGITPLNVSFFRFLLTVKRESGTSPAPEKNKTKNFRDTIKPNVSQTISLTLNLNDVSPATYNVTAFLHLSAGEKVYVTKGEEIDIRSSLNLPSAVWIVIGIAFSGILVFIAYYLSGRIR